MRTTLKRCRWNVNTPTKKVVWQCINYINKDADTGKRCRAKAVDDEVLKAAFVKVYNEDFRDKENFLKTFLANVEKVIEKNSISSTRISELITMKLLKQIDDPYNREYQRLIRELTDLKIQKDELDKTSLQRAKDKSKLSVVKDIIGDGTQPLTEFDEDLFDQSLRRCLAIRRLSLSFGLRVGRK